jgi:tetrahydrodipicolinate N-succinyltransferase
MISIAQHSYVIGDPIIIGDYVYIWFRAIILPGVRIGYGAVIDAVGTLEFVNEETGLVVNLDAQAIGGQLVV